MPCTCAFPEPGPLQHDAARKPVPGPSVPIASSERTRMSLRYGNSGNWPGQAPCSVQNVTLDSSTLIFVHDPAAFPGLPAAATGSKQGQGHFNCARNYIAMADGKQCERQGKNCTVTYKKISMYFRRSTRLRPGKKRSTSCRSSPLRRHAFPKRAYGATPVGASPPRPCLGMRCAITWLCYGITSTFLFIQTCYI